MKPQFTKIIGIGSVALTLGYAHLNKSESSKIPLNIGYSTSNSKLLIPNIHKLSIPHIYKLSIPNMRKLSVPTNGVLQSKKNKMIPLIKSNNIFKKININFNDCQKCQHFYLNRHIHIKFCPDHYTNEFVINCYHNNTYFEPIIYQSELGITANLYDLIDLDKCQLLYIKLYTETGNYSTTIDL